VKHSFGSNDENHEKHSIHLAEPLTAKVCGIWSVRSPTWNFYRNRLSCPSVIQDDSKLLSRFPWPIIFKPETIE
jgi:hypothetical protein